MSEIEPRRYKDSLVTMLPDQLLVHTSVLRFTVGQGKCILTCEHSSMILSSLGIYIYRWVGTSIL